MINKKINCAFKDCKSRKKFEFKDKEEIDNFIYKCVKHKKELEKAFKKFEKKIAKSEELQKAFGEGFSKTFNKKRDN